ncbi:hypothetical protein F6B43_10495 [Microbacterium rhizomatis]|uniref:Uncharacterized protein n=1 Tax=Microbacterium rhizomatis TaxID=1631477 RepID=A0A5J5J508_9MICO|nr:hypothetical protein F6B43_10495 [Microbacterium rhizomatis]
MALGYGVVGFVALSICGLGVASLILDEDVISVPGLGPIPGILGMIVATAGFAGALWPALRRPRPSFVGALVAGLAAFLGYLAGVWSGGLLAGADPAAATAAVGRVATSWFGLVLAVAGAVAGWGAIALVRTRAHRPHWPWEGDEDE